MRFRLGHLFGVMLLVGVLCGLVFAAPPAIGTPILVLIQFVCPAIWFSGAFFATGRWRAFFIGGIAAGVAPYIACLYTCAAIYLSGGWVVSPIDSNLADTERDPLWMPAVSTAWWISNLFFFIPGVFSLVGGGLSVGVYWIFNPSAQRERADHSPFIDQCASNATMALPPGC